jgi:hypothetical protein
MRGQHLFVFLVQKDARRSADHKESGLHA